MASKQVRRLPVVDASGALVGMVSLADVARFVAGLKRGRDSASTLLAATFTRTTGADWPTASGNGEH
jgi:CBS domain-containing protein